MMAASFTALFLPALLAGAAASDLRCYRIPNQLCLALAAGFVLHGLVAGLAPAAWLSAIACAALFMVLGFGLWLGGLLGAGDVKLNAAVGLWLGLGLAPSYLMVMALAGGGVALLLVAVRHTPVLVRCGKAVGLDGLVDRSRGVPYALAIAFAGGWMFPAIVAASE